MTLYADYSRDRIGWFFGLTGPQLILLAAASLPALWFVRQAAWASVALAVAGWGTVCLLTIVPVRGRSAMGWTCASLAWAVGRRAAWTTFTSRSAVGETTDPDAPDLPGVLQGIQIHEGPPYGPTLARLAIIQNHATRTWAITAAVVHPGIGLSEPDERDRLGHGLGELLELASRTELIDELLLTLRTVPDDGAERDIWVRRHRSPTAPLVSTTTNAELAAGLSQASVRTEAFVTLVIPETRLRKPAREAGGGIEGRARTLYLIAAEIEAALRGCIGMTNVDWLTSPQLALACRTAFAPADRVAIIDALAARESDPGVLADIPWAMAGPSGADTAARHYSHDAWNSISSTVALPASGAAMGALAAVLTPAEPGERRSYSVAFPLVSQTAADRRAANAQWAADLGGALRSRAGVRTRARQRDDTARAHDMDRKLTRGSVMTRPYAVCTVTVPKTLRVSEFGRRLDASVRRSGFAPLRLDLSQDAGFAMSTLPLGLGLARRSDR